MFHDRKRKKRALSILLPIGISAFIATMAAAAVPSLINFQGKLLDTNGNPRNGTYSMTFSIWDAASGGSQLWSETQGSVPVSNGVFSVQLGAVSSIATSVFSGASTYLQVQIGGETASARQRLVTSPYAYRSSIADDVAAGSANYIQNTASLQSGATFYVSSGTVSGPLRVGGAITAGSGNNQITTATGLLDAAKLSGTVPSANVSGTYSNALTLSNAGNSISGNGSGLTNVIANGLLPGDTDYIQNTSSLQSGSTFYVSSGTVAGQLTVSGKANLGGTAGVDDVTVNSNLVVNGAGPHAFTGDIQVNGEDLRDSAGTSRITLGANTTINGNLGAPAGQAGVLISTAVLFVGTTNGENYIAFPFTAGATIAAKDVVIISGANSVGTTTIAKDVNVLGVAVNGASAGQTVHVATMGIVTDVVANGAISVGARVCTTTSAGRVSSCSGANQDDGKSLGKALTGTSAQGETFTLVLWPN